MYAFQLTQLYSNLTNLKMILERTYSNTESEQYSQCFQKMMDNALSRFKHERFKHRLSIQIQQKKYPQNVNLRISKTLRRKNPQKKRLSNSIINLNKQPVKLFHVECPKIQNINNQQEISKSACSNKNRCYKKKHSIGQVTALDCIKLPLIKKYFFKCRGADIQKFDSRLKTQGNNYKQREQYQPWDISKEYVPFEGIQILQGK